jgi:hypothetical protein
MEDKLQCRGIPHLVACPLCDHEPETLQHLLLGSVVAQEVWDWALRRRGKLDWLPNANAKLVDWWTSHSCLGAHKRDMWTSIILVF